MDERIDDESYDITSMLIGEFERDHMTGESGRDNMDRENWDEII